jgi:microsomal epoxide hydrolase
MSAPLRPFRIDVPDEKLDWIDQRVASYRWYTPPGGPLDDHYAYGMSTKVLKDIVDYWQQDFSWRAAEADLNKFPQFLATIDGLDVHFVHLIGEADGQRPLLVTHGWPGSVYEFWQVAEPLAFPSRFGGKAEDAFDLIIPSLPGYGFSGKPDKPFGQRATAAIWDRLMCDVLGYDTYLAQGGDWGAMVTSWLGLNHGTHDAKGGCKAIHLNMFGLRPTPATPQNDDEIAWLNQSQANMQAEGSYLMQQMTKPQSLALGLMDSPVGQAAWIFEKFNTWSDLRGGILLDIYSRDQLITNLMIYLVNDAFATSVLYYRAFAEEGGPGLPQGVRCETPTGFANFPGETVYGPPPRSWIDRAYNISHWSEMSHGGHFAAMEAPDLFVQEIRGWARGLD